MSDCGDWITRGSERVCCFSVFEVCERDVARMLVTVEPVFCSFWGIAFWVFFSVVFCSGLGFPIWPVAFGRLVVSVSLAFIIWRYLSLSLEKLEPTQLKREEDLIWGVGFGIRLSCFCVSGGLALMWRLASNLSNWSPSCRAAWESFLCVSCSAWFWASHWFCYHLVIPLKESGYSPRLEADFERQQEPLSEQRVHGSFFVMNQFGIHKISRVFSPRYPKSLTCSNKLRLISWEILKPCCCNKRSLSIDCSTSCCLNCSSVFNFRTCSGWVKAL